MRLLTNGRSDESVTGVWLLGSALGSWTMVGFLKWRTLALLLAGLFLTTLVIGLAWQLPQRQGQLRDAGAPVPPASLVTVAPAPTHSRTVVAWPPVAVAGRPSVFPDRDTPGSMPAAPTPPATVALLELSTPVPTTAASPVTPALTPLPTIGAGDPRLPGAATQLVATPTPEPFQIRIPGTEVKLARQTLFMSQVSRPPDFWPYPQTVFYQRTARHICWLIELDYTAVAEDFSMAGVMRWLNVTGGKEHLILEQQYDLDAAALGNTLFFIIGNDAPGFWHPGEYRVELLDNRGRLAAFYEFRVKSGVL